MYTNIGKYKRKAREGPVSSTANDDVVYFTFFNMCYLLSLLPVGCCLPVLLTSVFTSNTQMMKTPLFQMMSTIGARATSQVSHTR